MNPDFALYRSYSIPLLYSDLRRWQLALEYGCKNDIPRDPFTDRVRNLPRFDNFGQNLPLLLGFGFVGLIYGGLHCVAWNAPFVSELERILWKLSSIVITATGLVAALLLVWTKSPPVLYPGKFFNRLWDTTDPIYGVFDLAAKKLKRCLELVSKGLEAMEKQCKAKREERGGGNRSEEEHQSEAIPKDENITLTSYIAILLWYTAVLFHVLARRSIYLLHFLMKASLDITIALCCILYVLARLYLVVISFINLAFLPDEAYTLVQWARYVPHVG